ncbi:1-(5-phosphoribosyl)-5-[(5-phosphoribosylamino) methylideneamino] imidazole-4-carboxamide isomerase [Leptospira kobayashii]|uniref:1-(5-phosphoribosyl)-5-[(5-phosphoribosylamino)methylideneamino] imidazole-4-carboxamide isomerase n=1 Tax=Leptospira kobayashii TaxID=1917830 RepID=A0ABN6KF88_9LEPT|nr:1-(5-phosphoribosyl)-5-[(5-phosphoribosylamino)methylideneamino]imidazole-4-carboxamide isomerase [Leptospira kobayashii]BDA79745.1 1-(5-phosphoribosyl)-5-[(5-phosphoribosylamino) methylideneamino] imidazole-4-carboxamide isomerase [Leptospira kobayashii]
MFIIPAIDLLDNEAVRLTQGDYSQKTVYSSHPEEMAISFEKDGGKLLHIVDLNAAKTGQSKNEVAIRNIRSSCNMKLELGGGIRSLESMLFFDDLGIDRFILGTIAVEKPEVVREGISRFGVDRIVVGVDAKDGYVRTKGWETNSGITSVKFLEQMYEVGVRHIIFTDISKDGMMLGPNFGIYKEFLDQFSDLKLIASGGVSSLSDLKELSRITEGKLYGAITGKAVYEGKINLKETFLEFSKV